MGIFRARPNGSLADNPNDAAPGRHNWYGEQVVQPMGGGNWGFADEGSYFVATNATLATGIAGHAAPVVADTDTKALLHLFNGGSRNIVLDFLQLEVTAAGTAGTLHYTVVYIDNKGSTALSSGGTSITPVNANSGSTVASAASITFGACVTAMTSSRKVGQMIVRSVIPVVQDTTVMKFGGPNAGYTSSLQTSGTAIAHAVQHFAPVVIGPGGNLNISQIRPSQSAASSYQFQLGYWER